MKTSEIPKFQKLPEVAALPSAGVLSEHAEAEAWPDAGFGLWPLEAPLASDEAAAHEPGTLADPSPDDAGTILLRLSENRLVSDAVPVEDEIGISMQTCPLPADQRSAEPHDGAAAAETKQPDPDDVLVFVETLGNPDPWISQPISVAEDAPLSPAVLLPAPGWNKPLLASWPILLQHGLIERISSAASPGPEDRFWFTGPDEGCDDGAHAHPPEDGVELGADADGLPPACDVPFPAQEVWPFPACDMPLPVQAAWLL
jgi:hypothetical protein